MKDAEATLLRIPGVTEAQVFAKVLVRCVFPMTDETIIALQEAQDWIEHETGWKVEMTISAGKRPEPMPRTDNELEAEFAAWERVSDETWVNFEQTLERMLRRSGCVTSISRSGRVGSPVEMIVECTLPLDVETAVGLQIMGQKAETDPDLELTILASLGEE